LIGNSPSARSTWSAWAATGRSDGSAASRGRIATRRSWRWIKSA
jgi:hypothetical protein